MKIGDNVSVIDDDLWGIVTSIHGNEVVFRDEYHFTHRYPKHLLTLRDASLYEPNTHCTKTRSQSNL